MGQQAGVEILTNDKVVTMVKAGLPTDIIVNKIHSSSCSFNTDTDELIRLRQLNIPTEIINAVVEASKPGVGQNDLPTVGSFDDIKDLSKVYVAADNESRKAILKELNKQPAFSLVDKPEEAQFFLEYKTISRQQFSVFTGGTTETGQLDAYVRHDGKKIVAWSESMTAGGFKGDTAHRLIGKFLKRVKDSH
jgi:hypothetical protein